MPEQHLGQRELTGGQLHLLAPDGGPSGAQVEHDVTGLQRRLVRGAAVPEPDLDPGQELFEAEGLGDVIVGPSLQTGHRVPDAGAGGEDDDRKPLSPAAYLGQHLVTVHEGKAEVEDHEIEVLVTGSMGSWAARAELEGRTASNPDDR